MPRDVTVKFDDGTSHVYSNAPDDITPEMVTERAQKEFSKAVVRLDGGRKSSQASIQNMPEEKSYLSRVGENIGNEVAGLVRGAGSIGNTLITANEKLNESLPLGGALIGSQLLAKATGSMSGNEGTELTNYESRAKLMDEGLNSLGANQDSGFFKGGKIAGEIAGTAGVGEVIAAPLALSKITAPLAESVATGGLGVKGSTIGSLFKRASGGAITGGASTALVDPDSAGTGASIGAALPSAISSLSKGFRIAGEPVNEVSDATLKASTDAGYVVPPSGQNAGVIPRVMEGISGKAKTEQAAVLKNQPVTDSLARKALGIPDGTPLTPEVTQLVIRKAVNDGYDPVKNAGEISTDANFGKDLSDLYDKYQGAASSFPGAVKDDVKKVLDGYKVAKFDAGDAIKAIRSLRDDANANFTKGDSDLANTQKGIAKAIENQIERGLKSSGAEGEKMLDDFRAARKLIAKAYTVEEAIKEGSGSVNAARLAARVQAGKPMDGELKTIGDFANNYSKIARLPQGGDANPFTVLDAAIGSAGAGAGIATGNPLLTALPLARVGARSAILSPSMQKAMSRKQSISSLAASLPANAATKSVPVFSSDDKKKAKK